MSHFSPRWLLPSAHLLVAAGLSILCASSATADEWCTLTFKDGRTLSGVLVEQSDTQITLRPEGGINTAFPKAELSGIHLEKSPREEYAEKRAAIKGDDQSGRYSLLVLFYSKNEKNASAVQFAKLEAEQLVKDFPDSTQIKKLLRVITERVEKASQPAAVETSEPDAQADPKKSSPAKTAGNNAAQTDEKSDAQVLPTAPVVGLLSASDQNLLRLYELDFKIIRGRIGGPDAKATVIVPKEVSEALLKNHPDAEELKDFKGSNGLSRFRSMVPLAQLDFLFAVQDKTLYPKVEVKTEPVALQAFRSKIHPNFLVQYFTPYFAGQIPGLIAKPKSASSQVEAYTNFLALSLAQVNGHRAIDRDAPEKSLLLQWGLPRENADYPAPNIKGWKPYFTSMRDPHFVEIAHWIKSLYGEATPTYSITLPAVASDPKPASEMPLPTVPRHAPPARPGSAPASVQPK